MSVYRPSCTPQMFPFCAVTRTSQELRAHQQSPGLDVRERCKTSELQNFKFSTGRVVPTVFENFFLAVI